MRFGFIRRLSFRSVLAVLLIAAMTAGGVSCSAVSSTTTAESPTLTTQSSSTSAAASSSTTAAVTITSTLAAEYQPPELGYFSALSWTKAFDKLHEKFSREYAFTEWKNIDWNALYSLYQPRIASAEASNNQQAYYLALREYVHSIPDGHVGFDGNDFGTTKELVGGGFGMTIAKLDNGQVVASWVKEGGPAAAAGIKSGAQILECNGKPIAEALKATSTLFGPVTATDVSKEYEQLRFLVRAPIGTNKTMAFKNPDAAAVTTATLQAIDDNFETLSRTDMVPTLLLTGWPEKMIEQKTLPGNVGYISIFGEIDLPEQLPGDHTPTLTLFRNAIDYFINQKATGIIIDLRGNAGGSDQMSADFLASFYDTRTLYEYQTWYNTLTGKLEPRTLDETAGVYWPGDNGVYISPAPAHFSGPVVALVNHACKSSGEGVAMGIKNLPNGKVAGFYGTNGSFGMAGDAALMPGKITVKWPFGQSLDKNHVVQLDSRNGEGGVTPNARVPMTLENVLRAANGEDVVLDYGLQVLSQMRGEE